MRRNASEGIISASQRTNAHLPILLVKRMAIGLCLLSRMSGFLAFLDAATSLSTAAGLGAAACLKAVSWVSGEPSSLYVEFIVALIAGCVVS